MHFSHTNVYSFSEKQVEALRTIDASIKALSLQRKDIENIGEQKWKKVVGHLQDQIYRSFFRKINKVRAENSANPLSFKEFYEQYGDQFSAYAKKQFGKQINVLKKMFSFLFYFTCFTLFLRLLIFIIRISICSLMFSLFCLYFYFLFIFSIIFYLLFHFLFLFYFLFQYLCLFYFLFYLLF